MTLEEQRDIIQAKIDGKELQVRSNYASTINSTARPNWVDATVFRFNFADYEYRIKPQPREFWAHPVDLRDYNCFGPIAIKLREVLE